MPNRILREGILTSSRMVKLGWAEEVFYRRLHSVVDDFGRYYADAGMLRAACYPRQLNKVSDSDIEKWLACVQKAALVRVYPAEDGERYLEVSDFGQQVRAKKSKFPGMRSTCVADAQQPQANEHLDVSVFVSVSEADNTAPAVVSPASPATVGRASKKCPAGFVVTPEMLLWAEKEAPSVDIEKQTETLKDYTFKNAITDWHGAWRNWMRRCQAESAGKQGFRGAPAIGAAWAGAI